MAFRTIQVVIDPDEVYQPDKRFWKFALFNEDGTPYAPPSGTPGSGVNGVDGKSAYEIAVDNGFSGTPAEWLESLIGPPGSGLDGQSAYEIAVANGYSGTPTEWLASLVGPPGNDGASNKRMLPEPSGGDDRSALNSALMLGGNISGIQGAVYKVSGPIVVQSKTFLDLTGCTIKFSNSTIRDNMLINQACIPVATATDADTTQGNSDVISPTLAAVAQIGQAVAVVGAGAPGGDGGGPIWLYGQVKNVNVATGAITLGGNAAGVKAHVTLTDATAYLFNRDHDIEIVGGEFDMEDNWQLQADRIAAGVHSYPIRLRRVDVLKVYDQVLRMVKWTGGLGWANGVAFGDCTDFLFDNIHSDQASTTAAGDGPLARGVIRNMHGTTQDDHVALGCVGYQGQDMEGDIIDVEVDGIFPNDSWSALKMNAGTGSNGAQRVMRVSAKAIKGTTKRTAIQVIDYGVAAGGYINALLDDVPVKPADGYGAINNAAAKGVIDVVDHKALRYGYQLMTFEPENAAAPYITGSAFMHLSRLDLPFDVVPEYIDLWVATAGAGLTAARNFVGIYDASGVLRYKSGDQSTAWQTVGPKRVALTAQTASLTLRGAPGSWCWVAYLANGTTAPAFSAKVSQMPANLGLVPGTSAGPYVGTIAATLLRHRAGYLTVGARNDLPASIANDTFSDNNLKSQAWAGVLAA